MLTILYYISIFPLLLAQRSDYDSSFFLSGGNTLLGSPVTCTGTLDSSNPIFCPENTWIYGFYLLTYNSSFGILNIVLDCRNQFYDASSSQLVQYNNMGTYGSYSLVTSSLAICNGDYGRDFVRGFSLQMWCPTNVVLIKGIINVKMRCSFSNDIVTNLVPSDGGGWTGTISACKLGTVACGYEFYYKGDTSGTNANFGSTDMNFKCCKICDMNNGFMFLSASKTCGHCDMNCLSCYGISTNCTACPSGYTLSSTNSCITVISMTLVTQEFYDPSWTISGWSFGGSVPAPSENSCSPFSLIGGLNVFSQNTWFTKTVGSLINHNMLKIRVKFYFLGSTSWGIACGFIYVDTVLQLTMNMSYTATSMYYATTDCANILLYIRQVDINVPHTASTAAIKFTTNLTVSTGYWGISHFMLQTYFKCDSSCLTCTGTSSNQCSSCSTGKFLTSGNACASSCTSSYFADSSTNTCTTTCPSPYYGDPTTNLCKTSCADNYYKRDSDRICYKPCPSTYYGNPLTGLCVSTCPNGMYGDGNNLCSFCDFNCATCSGSSSNCGGCTYTWLGSIPSCSNPSYISNIENTIFNHNTLTTTDFTNSVWSISNAYSGNKVYTCGTYIMAGGYSIAGSSAALSKSYSGLSPHLNVRITFFAMKIGNWNNNILKVIADSTTFPSLTFQTTDDTTAYKPCGSTTYTEALRRVDIYFSHTADTLSVSITSDLSTDASVSSWGIFDLTITLFLCDSTCKSCTILNDATKCMSCTTGSTLYLQSYVGPAQCLSTCPSNTYKYTSNNTCLICDSTCATCSAGTTSDCKSCLANTYLLLPPGPSICSSVCNAAYYKDDASWQCLNCDTTCATCSIAGASGCLTCKSGTYLQSTPGPSSCLSTCPDGKYKDATLKCLACDGICKTCAANDANSCLSCNSPNYLQSPTGAASACLSTCPDGTYPDGTSRQCFNCDSTCATCSIAGASDCLTCKSSTYLQFSPGPSSCLSSCPDGKYKDATLTCLACDGTCKTCTANDANSCLSCNSPNYLQSPTGAASACLSTCTDGTYKYDSTQQCLLCDSSCVTCSLPGISGCLTCPTNNYLQSSPGPSSCLSSCPDGKYKDISLMCLTCETSCKNCLAGDVNSCTSCDLPRYLQYPLSSSSACLSTCPDGAYEDSTTKQCLACDATCSTCSIAGSANCLTCKTSTYLQLSSGPSSCLSTCPDGRYKDAILKCLPCDTTCKTCLAGDANSCFSCDSPTYLQSSVGAASSCQNTCPSGTYQDDPTRQCLSCDTTCVTCSIAGPSGCLTCKLATYLQISPGPSSCLSSCPDHKYEDSSLICLNCDSSCKTCIASDANSCTSCDLPNYLQSTLSTSSSCQTTCPDGTYKDSTLKQCLLCDTTCLTCSSNGPSNCLTCQTNNYLQLLIGPSSCLTTCPNTKYPDSSNICLLCDSSCKSCLAAGPSSCSSCNSPDFLQASIGPASCLNSCPNGKYSDISSRSCLTCDNSCLTCSSGGNSACLSCQTNLYLQSIPGPSYCLSTCPTSTYKDTSSNQCINCDSSCLTCIGSSASTCLSCKSNTYLESSPGACVSICLTGYLDTSTNACLSCDSACSTCVSSGPYKCLSCAYNFYYLKNAYGFVSCLSDCPSNTYKNNTNMTCLPCDSSCLTCNDSTSSDCLSCESPNILFSTPPSQCLSSCGNRYYYNDTLQICDSCYKLCELCSAYGSSLCNSCVYNFYLGNYPGPSSCISNCPTSFYKNHTIGACQACDNSCLECLASGTSGCNLCNNGYYLIKSNNNSLTGNCTKINMITPALINYINPLSYILIFSSNYTTIYSLYKNYTKISIAGIADSLFNYKITPINNTDNYTIDFNLNFSITNYPLITVYLNPTANISTSYNIALTTYTLQTKMQYYYYMDSSTKQMINSTKQTTEAFNSVVSKSFIANNLMSFTSSLIFQFMISMDTIRFLRYFQIKYPENALALFNSQMPTADIIPNINIIEDPDDGNLPEIFQNYGVSIYIFNNNGNSLIEVLCYWIFGIICLVFVKSFRQYNKKYIKVVLILISVVFVWSYSVSYFLSNYMNFAFYTLLAYRFPTTKTGMGLFNFAFSFVIGILVMVIFPFVLVKIKKIRPDMLIKGNSSNKNIIVPINNTNTNESKKGLICESGRKSPDDNSIFQPDNYNKLIIENLDTPAMSPKIDSPELVKNETKSLSQKLANNIKKVSKFIRKSFRKSSDSPFDWRVPDSVDMVGEINDQSSKTISWKNSAVITPKKNNLDANRYGALYKDFRHDKPFQSYFILISLFKQLIYCLIITCSFDNPYHGLILANVFFGLFLIMMIIVRPLKERGDNIQNVFNEACGVAAMGCAMYMAYMDQNNIFDEELKLNLGWGIVFANILLIAAFLLRMIFAWARLFYVLTKEMVKMCKKRYKKGNKIMDEDSAKEKVDNQDADKGVFDKIIEMENFLR